MTSANRQQSLLQCVDAVHCHRVWSEGRSQRRATLSGCRSSYSGNTV